ncbi:MAG: SpoIVB peptidase [Bacillota bacterium]|nr:SpoIVB peptidase [Bacillota bacterium]
MKRKIFVCIILCAALLCSGALADSLAVGGTPLGISMRIEGVAVAGFSEVETDSGTISPAEAAGLEAGDIIVKLGSNDIATAKDFTHAVAQLDGKEISVTVSRGDKLRQFNLTPAKDTEGVWRLGVWLRDAISGVGTLTFYDPESGLYGALGHSISDSDTGRVMPLHDGSICSAEIVDVIPGKAGAPGELCGCSDEAVPLGDIQINCVCGIFGTGDLPAEDILETGEMKQGKALIRCTLDGSGVQEYEIEIQKVAQGDGCTTAVIHVTDSALLEKTGGIVQGMSGSPIIQDGELVGAVTHVFVNDPTSGYGISIYDMLDAAQAVERAA